MCFAKRQGVEEEMPNSKKLISFFSDTRSQFFPKYHWYNMLANKTTWGPTPLPLSDRMRTSLVLNVK